MNDGGPAFARTGNDEHDAGYDSTSQDGLSPWELFAAATLIGDRANPRSGDWSDERHSEYAFDQADAMIAERNKRKEKANADNETT